MEQQQLGMLSSENFLQWWEMILNISLKYVGFLMKN